jgi:hypothetical protein
LHQHCLARRPILQHRSVRLRQHYQEYRVSPPIPARQLVRLHRHHLEYRVYRLTLAYQLVRWLRHYRACPEYLPILQHL